MNSVKRIGMAAGLAAMLAGCGIIGGDDDSPKTPTLGTRIPVLTSEGAVEVDPTIADVAVVLPAPITNADWTQPGGNSTKALGHVALGATLSPAWSARVEGSTPYERLAASPIVAEGKVFVVDTAARVHAFDATTGAALWKAQVGDTADRSGGGGGMMEFLMDSGRGNRGSLFGGGVSYDGGKLFATSGLGDVSAINAADGAILWKKRPGGPLRGAPGVGNGNIYAMSQDNQLFALRTSDGNVEWSRAGTLENAGVFGVGAPAVAQGTVIAGYSSGELAAYRYENGQEVWQDALARTSISTAVATLSDVDADPVIDQGRVFAVGLGGRTVSLELVTGQRLWEINVAGISTPWVAGEWLFVVTEEAKLLCLSRVNGKVRWMAQLRRWRDEDDKKGPLSWQGPVLAGGRLVLVSTRGDLVHVNPADGAVQTETRLDNAFNLAPVVANNMMYTLDDSGKLQAWR